MSRNLLSHALRLASTSALLILVSACTDIETGFDGAYESVFGDSTPSQKIGVKSSAAAPYQDVKAADVAQNDPLIELGSMSDKAPEAIEGEEANVSAEASVPSSLIIPPVDAVPPAEAAAVVDTAPSVADAGGAALLTVRFNQPHVYYDDALAKAVNEAEKAKPDVIYEVLSNMPNLSSLPPDQQDKLSKRGQNNLRNVVIKMQQMGVPPQRIRVANQTLTLRSQEIQVFVR